MAWSPERTNTGSKPSCRRTIPSISPSDGSSSTTSTLPFTRYRPLPSTDNRPRMSCQRPTVEYPPSPQTSRTPLTGPCGLVTMRASADERKTVTSPPPPWEPPGQPSGQPGQPPAGPGQGAPGWGPPPAGPPGPPGWGPPPGPPGRGVPSQYPPPPLPKAGSARTGPLPLHPMMFSDLLDGSFRLLKANLGTIVLVAAVFLIPVNLVAAFLQRDLLGGYGFLQFMQDPSLPQEAAGPGASNGPLVGSLVATLATVLVTPFIGGATSMVVAASYLGGELKAGPAMRATGRRFLVLLAVFFLTLLLKIGGLVLCVVGVLIPMTFFLVT